jgi:hypothetical protein
MNEVISKILGNDPYEGPFEGEDYLIDDDGVIHVGDPRLAATICRKVNMSNKFTNRLVNIGKSGDMISLGFDEIADTISVHSEKLGSNKDLKSDIKTDGTVFYVYLEGKRKTKTFNTLSIAKAYCKKLSNQLDQLAEVNETDDD